MRKIIICKRCKELRNHKALGLCKKCYNKQYSLKHKKERHEYRRINRKKLLAHDNKYYHLNKDRIKIQRKEYRQNGRRRSVRIKTMGKNQYWAYNTGKYIHLAIAEKVLGRRLKPGECCHHIDGNGLNNLYSNLMICTMSYHTWLHEKIGKRRKKRDPKGRFAGD